MPSTPRVRMTCPAIRRGGLDEGYIVEVVEMKGLSLNSIMMSIRTSSVVFYVSFILNFTHFHI